MLNKIIFIIFCFLFLFNSKVFANDQFTFDVSKIEISENGDKIIGTNRGLITSNNGMTIQADNFQYNRKKNLLKLSGNVLIVNSLKKYQIFADKVSYFKNKDIISAKNQIKFIDNDQRILTSNNFLYDLKKNIFEAKGNVKS